MDSIATGKKFYWMMGWDTVRLLVWLIKLIYFLNDYLYWILYFEEYSSTNWRAYENVCIGYCLNAFEKLSGNFPPLICSSITSNTKAIELGSLCSKELCCLNWNSLPGAGKLLAKF